VTTVALLWHHLLAFVFYYPLFMSFLWMAGAALFYWRCERRDPPFDQPRPLCSRRINA